jgi:prepilin-type N-terminal cleavage/methylation domain-containing protein
MTRQDRRTAFTLIELLIVVAIIAILALIAVPNFLEAQTRAKVSRSKTDQRTVHVGIMSLQVDHNVLLVDFWDDDHPEIVDNRLHDLFGCIYQERDARGGIIGVLVPITTPMAYLTSLPLDPFASDDGISTYISTDPPLVAGDRLPPFSYFYIDNDPEVSGEDFGLDFYKENNATGRAHGIRPLRDGHFVTMGLGPIRSTGGYTGAGIPYDPTNGTASEGYIIRRSDSGDHR